MLNPAIRLVSCPLQPLTNIGGKAVGRGSASTEQGQEVHEEKAPILSPILRIMIISVTSKQSYDFNHFWLHKHLWKVKHGWVYQKNAHTILHLMVLHGSLTPQSLFP